MVTGPIDGGTGVDSFGAPITSVLIETTGPASTLTIAGIITGSNSDGFGTPYAVELHATGAITETSAGSISAGSLLARTQNGAGASITLDNPANAVPGSVTLSALDAFGIAAAPGAITFFDSTGFTINSAPGGGVGGLELGITTTGTATLQAAGTIDQNGASGIINAQNLVVRTLNDSGADILLGTANNTVPGNVTLTTLNAAGTAIGARVHRLFQYDRVHDRIDRRIGDRRRHDCRCNSNFWRSDCRGGRRGDHGRRFERNFRGRSDTGRTEQSEQCSVDTMPHQHPFTFANAGALTVLVVNST